jgi:hypothetical protein
MALVEQYFGFLKVGDSRQKFTTVEIRLQTADALAWNAAIGAAAKAATQAGVLMAAIEGLTAGIAFERGVRSTIVDDAAAFPAPDDNVYNFDKINVTLKAGLDRSTVTIPARDDAQYNVASDGVTVIISGAGASAATTAYVAAVADAVQGKNGDPAVVEKMYIQR